MSSLASKKRLSKIIKSIELIFIIFLSSSFFLVFRNQGIYGDGPWILESWMEGAWFHGHPMILPAAKIMHSLLSIFINTTPDFSFKFLNSISAGIACGGIFYFSLKLWGRFSAYLCLILLILVPTLRFFAGAVEVHILPFLFALIAGIFALYPVKSKIGGILLTSFGYILLSLAHLSCIGLGPAILLLHLGKKQKQGIKITFFTFIIDGILILGITAFSLLLFDKLVISKSLIWISGISSYGKYMVQIYDTSYASPPIIPFLVSEIISPYGLILIIFALGIRPLWNKYRFFVLGIITGFVSLVLISYKIGAREYGAYILPSVAGLMIIGAAGIHELKKGLGIKTNILILLSIILMYSLEASWWVDFNSNPNNTNILPVGWTIRKEDLGIPFFDLFKQFACLLSPVVWMALFFLLILILIFKKHKNKAFHKKFSIITLLILLPVSFVSSEITRKAWPFRWNQPWIDYSKYCRKITTKKHLLIGWAGELGLHYIIKYYLNGNWIDLGFFHKNPSKKEINEWEKRVISTIEAYIKMGRKIYLSEDGIVMLLLMENGPNKKEATSFLQRILTSYKVYCLPFWSKDLKKIAENFVEFKKIKSLLYVQ